MLFMYVSSLHKIDIQDGTMPRLRSGWPSGCRSNIDRRSALISCKSAVSSAFRNLPRPQPDQYAPEDSIPILSDFGTLT